MNPMHIPKPLGLRLLSVLLVSFFLLPSAQAQLGKDISRVLKKKGVDTAKVGIYAVDVESGKPIYALKQDEAFNPASNMKLITSAAALTKFGPSHSIFTRVSAAKIEGSTIKEAIYIKGDGDPYLRYEDFMRWAVSLKRQGITKVEGDILVDDTTFDPGYMPPGFDQKNEDASYRAPIGAVSVNFNSVVVTVTPGENGKPAVVSLYPPNDHVKIENKAKTTKGKSRRIGVKSISADGGTTIRVTGKIGVSATPGTWRKRIDDPSLFAGSVFKTALQDIGIEVTGKVDKATRPANTRSLVLHEGMPLIYPLMLMNKWSNNFMAEMVFRLLGEKDNQVTIGQAYEAIDALLSAAGVSGKYKVMNGSGLYTGNEFTPAQIVGVLVYMAKHRYASDYMTTLPIAGEDGTLRRRLKGNPAEGQLRGKTGTLNEVSALAGYLRSKSGKLIAYAILFNDTKVKAWTLRNEQDEIAQAIAEHAP